MPSHLRRQLDLPAVAQTLSDPRQPNPIQNSRCTSGVYEASNTVRPFGQGAPLTGNVALWETLVATALLLVLHWLLSHALARSPWLCRMLEGKAVVLGQGGSVQNDKLRRHASATQICLRLSAGRASRVRRQHFNGEGSRSAWMAEAARETPYRLGAAAAIVPLQTSTPQKQS